MDFPDTVYIGLVVTSNDIEELALVTIDNVYVTEGVATAALSTAPHFVNNSCLQTFNHESSADYVNEPCRRLANKGPQYFYRVTLSRPHFEYSKEK